MRCLIASLAVAVVALTVAPAVAQAPPPDSVSQVFRQKVAPGMVDKYEAGRKKHMAWHKAQGDPWTWNTYEVTTGPDTGSYLIVSSNHQWAELDTWTAKFGEGDTADANVSMAGAQAGSQMSFWMQLNALSRLAPAGTPPTPLVSLTTYYVKPGHDSAMTATVGKITRRSPPPTTRCTASGTAWSTVDRRRPLLSSRHAPTWPPSRTSSRA